MLILSSYSHWGLYFLSFLTVLPCIWTVHWLPSRCSTSSQWSLHLQHPSLDPTHRTRRSLHSPSTRTPRRRFRWHRFDRSCHPSGWTSGGGQNIKFHRGSGGEGKNWSRGGSHEPHFILHLPPPLSCSRRACKFARLPNFITNFARYRPIALFVWLI